MDNPYEVLGVSVECTKVEIRKAYKSKASKHHPDKETGDTKTFQKIKEAFEILYDDESRKQYDETGRVKKEESKTQMAMSTLATLVFDVINNSINNLEHVDLVEKIRNALNTNIDASNDLVTQCNSRIIKLNDIINRLSSNKSVLQDMVNSEIGNIEHKLRTISHKIEVFEIALDLVDDYTYDFNEKSEIIMNPTSIYSVFRWSDGV